MVNLTISPTWSDAFHYAFLSPSYYLLILLGVIGIALGVITVMKAPALMEKYNIPGFVAYFAAFIFFAGGVAIPYGKVADIRFENDKPMSEETEKYYRNMNDGNRYYFDSLYNNCLMLGAAHNCQAVYKK
jgi:hypothetical protein